MVTVFVLRALLTDTCIQIFLYSYKTIIKNFFVAAVEEESSTLYKKLKCINLKFQWNLKRNSWV